MNEVLRDVTAATALNVKIAEKKTLVITCQIMSINICFPLKHFHSRMCLALAMKASPHAVFYSLNAAVTEEYKKNLEYLKPDI